MGDVYVAGSGKGLVARLLSTMGTNADGTQTAVRVNKFGEQDVFLMSGKPAFRMAEEGSLFITTTPTPGTGVALGVATATAIIATAPSILIYNNDVVGGKNIYLDSIKLIATGAGTAGASVHATAYLDSTVRFTSGGTAATPVNANMQVPNTSISKIYDASAAILAPAASANVRLVGNALVRLHIPVVGDTYTLDFGGYVAPFSGALDTAVALSVAAAMPPVVIGPQQSFLLYIWSPSQSAAPTYEYVVVHSER